MEYVICGDCEVCECCVVDQYGMKVEVVQCMGGC